MNFPIFVVIVPNWPQIQYYIFLGTPRSSPVQFAVELQQTWRESCRLLLHLNDASARSSFIRVPQTLLSLLVTDLGLFQVHVHHRCLKQTKTCKSASWQPETHRLHFQNNVRPLTTNSKHKPLMLRPDKLTLQRRVFDSNKKWNACFVCLQMYICLLK